MRDTFGYQTVSPKQRQEKISHVFASIAPRYDLMNDLMSFGIHRWWKTRLVHKLRASKNALIVDLAGGTGDVGAKIYKSKGTSVIIVDASKEMVEAGKQKLDLPLHWLVATGEQMPFADNSIDVITLSFGLRNMTDIDAVLQEINRCLKPGGQFLCLEFSTPVFWLKPFYDFYSWAIIPRLGAFVAREPAAYQYLIESIRKFPNQLELCDQFTKAGFGDVEYSNYSFGICALHHGKKPQHLKEHQLERQ